MGYAWDSVILHQPDPESVTRLVQESHELARSCASPKVVVSVVRARRPGGSEFVSVEMAASRSKRAVVAPELLADLNRRVFGATPARFREAEVLLAHRASRWTNEPVLYLHYRSSSCSSGYALFAGGQMGAFEFLNWEGSDGYVTDRPRVRPQEESELLRRATAQSGWGLGLDVIDDVFQLFYEGPSEAQEYLLVEERRHLDCPRLLTRS